MHTEIKIIAAFDYIKVFQIKTGSIPLGLQVARSVHGKVDRGAASE
jgi:hypothetical protein